MSLPSLETLYQVAETTWPAHATRQVAGFAVRDGAGGGKRVSAATLAASLQQTDLAKAEGAMRDLGQTPLFQIRAGDEALDDLLAEAGYTKIDTVNVLVASAQDIATERPPLTGAIPCAEPLHLLDELWEAGGINAARRAVMDRCALPKTRFISRFNDKPAGAAFAAVDQGIAMLHALEIAPAFRRNGLATWIMRQCAFWALAHNASHVAVLCTQDNAAGNALYDRLGFQNVGQYHYRLHRNESL